MVYGATVSLVYYGYFTYYIETASKKDDAFPFKTVRALFPKRLEGEVNYVQGAIIQLQGR